MISRVRTQLSDGSIHTSSALTPETAALLARLNSNMLHNSIQDTGETVVEVAIEKLKDGAVEETTQQVSDGSVAHISPTEFSKMEEVHEPALPTEGVQLDLGLHYPPQVSEVSLEGD
ncbi:hypothetical protein EB796_016503 [Bugula neritina]|uniref:Uncharacterized protein n=1 Tax=Bugula neritina TaxID=10212 RepID=A0A7J7JFV3_BUGNE|nr:hypothetical protein EB796_016503 [Bugula neritina]